MWSTRRRHSSTGVANGIWPSPLDASATAGPLQRAGKLELLAVVAPKRTIGFDTVAESGGPAGFEVIGCNALASPRGLGPHVTEKIQRDVDEALAAPDVQEKFTRFEYEPFPQTRAKFAAFVNSEVIRKVNISID